MQLIFLSNRLKVRSHSFSTFRTRQCIQTSRQKIVTRGVLMAKSLIGQTVKTKLLAMIGIFHDGFLINEIAGMVSTFRITVSSTLKRITSGTVKRSVLLMTVSEQCLSSSTKWAFVMRRSLSIWATTGSCLGSMVLLTSVLPTRHLFECQC